MFFHKAYRLGEVQALSAIFAGPKNGNTEWCRIESLLVALDSQVFEGDCSRVTFILNGRRIYLHRLNPGKEALRYRVNDVHRFLQRAGLPHE